MGSGNQPKVWINDKAEKPDAVSLNSNFFFLNMQQATQIRNGTFEGIFSAGVPAFWTLSGTGAAAAQDADSKEAANAVLITFGSATAVLSQSGSEFKFYQGRRVKAWAFVKATVASQARIVINDGVGSTASTFHPGDGIYRLLIVEHVMSGAATELTLELRVELAGAGAKFDLATLVDHEDILGRLENPKDFPVTKEIFLHNPQNHNANNGDYRVRTVTETATTRLLFRVPTDFKQLVSIVLVGIPTSSGGPQTVDLNSDYAAAGEDANANSESATITPTWVANQMQEIDISSVVTGIAAGDYVGIQFNRQVAGQAGGDLDVLGLRVTYR